MIRPDDMIFCHCGTDALGIWSDPDDPLVEITMWRSGDWDLNWRTRLRFAWSWLRGKPHILNSVVLEPDELDELTAALRKVQQAWSAP